MHQVLSYDTTVHANLDRDYRAFITRRTFALLSMLIAFVCFILGILLGIYITERQVQGRKMIDDNLKMYNQHHQFELTSADYADLKTIRTYHRIKEQLLASAERLNKMNQDNDDYLSISLKTDIYNKYVSCTQEIPPNTNLDSTEFIEQLIDNTAMRQKDCMTIIQVIIDNNLANG